MSEGDEVRRRFAALAAGLLVVGVGVTAMAAQTTGPSRVTEEQAEAGRVVFERKCAACHVPDAGGVRRAPTLIGQRFLSKWGARKVRDLFVRMRNGMPPTGVRPRGDGYTNILAFLLHSNGQPAGTETLDPLSYDTVAHVP